MATPAQTTRTFPRRAFLAAGLSALFAGSATTLALLGGMSAVSGDTFRFSRGTSFANGEEARLRGLLASALADERLHVTIVGHTGSAGDDAANLELSNRRATFVAEMAVDMGITPERITARGIGGAAPLAQEDGETDRALQSRLARVEVTLQMRR